MDGFGPGVPGTYGASGATGASEFWRPGPGSKGPGPLGGGKVLVVDDEPDVCVYVALALKRLGFDAAGRTDPRDALELLRADPSQFRLLLTDQRMPGMTGLELIRQVWSFAPDYPVVLMSGYRWGIDPAQLPGVGFLSKPFETADLERAIRHALAH